MSSLDSPHARPGPAGLALGLATDAGFLVGVAALLVITGLYCAEVVLRYLLNNPTSWGIDAVSFLFLVSIYAVLPHATRTGGHIAVTIVQDSLPAWAGAWNRVLNGIGCALCLVAGWACLGETWRQVEQSVETMGAVTIPKWWLSGFVAYGFGLSALWFLRAVAVPSPAEPVLPFLRQAPP